MAWRSHGKTNTELIDNLHANGLMSSPRVVEAMKKVDRAKYCRNKSNAYQDSPQPIGYAATISAPHMHANAMENLLSYLRPGARVLDVGSGSGYLVACLHHVVSAQPSSTTPTSSSSARSYVLGIEHVQELADQSLRNLKDDGLGPALERGDVEVAVGDGRNPDPKHGGNWDVIHVGAAAPEMPQALVEQLAKPGRMFIPVGTYDQSIYQVDKDEQGKVVTTRLYGVHYVPLTSLERQRSEF